MSHLWKRLPAAVVACGVLSLVVAAWGADRTPEEILKDLEAVKMPTFDQAKIGDQQAIQAYMAERQKASEKRGVLIQELLKVAPENEKLATLLPERWMSAPLASPTGEDLTKGLLAEIDAVLGKTKDAKLKAEAAFAKLRLVYVSGMRAGKPDKDAVVKAADQFLEVAPKDDPRMISVVMLAAQNATDPAKSKAYEDVIAKNNPKMLPQYLYSKAESTTDDKEREALEDRILKEFPESPVVGSIKGARKQREGVGKPFELEFTDAIKGTTISMKDLAGKVVVVDFWATWCGPCVAEMPTMKKLYAEYKPKGVEFIGVSLDQPEDQGGLKKLKEFVEKNEIGWPQYYQGNYWQSEFSKSWGINAIPCVFVVDQKGNLYSVKARGKLEEIIPELLKKGKPDTGGE